MPNFTTSNWTTRYGMGSVAQNASVVLLLQAGATARSEAHGGVAVMNGLH